MVSKHDYQQKKNNLTYCLNNNCLKKLLQHVKCRKIKSAILFYRKK